MNILLTSNDKQSCPDHCDYDAGRTCIYIENDKLLHICERFQDTVLGKLINKLIKTNLKQENQLLE